MYTPPLIKLALKSFIDFFNVPSIKRLALAPKPFPKVHATNKQSRNKGRKAVTSETL